MDSCNVVVIGIVSVCHQLDSVLFDPSSTLSYLSIYFVSDLNMICKSLIMSICVTTLLGDVFVEYWMY